MDNKAVCVLLSWQVCLVDAALTTELPKRWCASWRGDRRFDLVSNTFLRLQLQCIEVYFESFNTNRFHRLCVVNSYPSVIS